MTTFKLISTMEAADRLGVSASYLNKLRVQGGGPPFVKMGARVGYDPDDLSKWIASQKLNSTSGTSALARRAAARRKAQRLAAGSGV